MAKNTESAKPGTKDIGSCNLVKQKEAVYTIKEFTANAGELFGTSPECVFAALRQQGITECTKAKAKEIVKAFRGRKVN